MKILNLVQGSPEWHAHRATARNASEAPAVMGFSPYKTRSQLLKEKATGLVPEVDAGTQARFDRGHESEAAARPNVEMIICDSLFPITATTDDGYLSASYDGMTADDDIFWENKLYNQTVEAYIQANNDLPDSHWPQLEQQCMVDKKGSALFTLCDEGGNVKLQHWYISKPERQVAVLAAWKQFDEDVAVYQHKVSAPEVVGRAPESLPALHIEVTGMVTASNLDAFKENALAVFQCINTDLQTDADFANAEKTVKWCGDVEERLEAAKQHALSQTASIDELFRAIDTIKAEARAKRLELDKLVKTRKENIRVEIQQEAQLSLSAYIQTINARIAPIQLPAIKADFAGAMKGKKTIDSLRGSADDELARAKIVASGLSEAIGTNLNIYNELAAKHQFLFSDLQQLVTKSADDFTLQVKSRIADHETKEAARIAAAVQTQLAVEKAAAEQKPAAPAATQAPAARVPVAESGKAFDLYKPVRPMPTYDEIAEGIAIYWSVPNEVAHGWLHQLNKQAAEVA